MKPASTIPPRFSLAVCLRVILGLMVLAAPGVMRAQSAVSKEYQVKAAFLFNFAQFVEWPAKEFSDANSPLVIGILGNDPFGAILDEMVRGEKVKGHPLIVQRYRQVEEIQNCHVLFLSPSESNQVERILERLRGRSLLTVSDLEGFAQKGGIIRFVTDKGKIRFRVNLEAAKRADLTISSKLLKAAEIVAPGKD
ncbi:MAG TPA: YfiR family protein [Verrucomicrobiae bacterium]|nr:YfiR family protein [Verrucomicrobiae bacterium]